VQTAAEFLGQTLTQDEFYNKAQSLVLLICITFVDQTGINDQLFF
jgi:hypothetical protein